MATNKHMETKSYILILFLILFLPFSEIIAKENEDIDISTPEKSFKVFVDAFRVGNDRLLDEVLIQNASIPEFHPLQKIECSSPAIVGFDITKFRVVLQKGQYSEQSQPGDIEIHAIIKFDESLLKKSKCHISLWSKGVYLFRSIKGRWKIVAAIPFWPEGIQEMLNQKK
jgi:hypothetical protein